MTFAEAAKKRTAERFIGRCTTCEFIAGLDDKLRPEVEEAMAMPVSVINAKAILDELAARGLNPPNQASIQRHRRNCGLRG